MSKHTQVTAEQATPSGTEGFTQFHLKPGLLKGIVEAGFTTPSPIQKQAIPLALQGHDMIGQARTGSGKTAAFVIPALERLDFERTGPAVLVLVPTRELSLQVSQEFRRLGRHLPLKVAQIVGGQSSFTQLKTLRAGAQVIVATPGRMLDLLQSGKIEHFEPNLVVLDEADEMLDMGFIDDLRAILAYTPHERQTWLFSATMPPAIARLAQDILNNPEHVKADDGQESPHKDIEQSFYLVRSEERFHALARLIDAETPAKSIVFCQTKQETIDLCQHLNERGYQAIALHGDMTQGDRQHSMRALKTGHRKLLIATDVASRGLDVDQLSHVFNFSMPPQKERYTHRIGRTGRAGNKGKAMTLITPADLRARPYFLSKSWAQSLGGRRLEFSTIPSLKSVQKRRQAAFIEKILSTEAQATARAMVNTLLMSYSADDSAQEGFSASRSIPNDTNERALQTEHPEQGDSSAPVSAVLEQGAAGEADLDLIGQLEAQPWGESMVELLAQLVSLAQGEHTLLGPERIGISAAEAKQWGRKSGSQARMDSRGRRSRRPGAGGGSGYRGGSRRGGFGSGTQRSAGGRPSSKPWSSDGGEGGSQRSRKARGERHEGGKARFASAGRSRRS